MNKKINYLAIIPIYGTIILLLWLFIKMTKQEINKKKFHAYFISSALFGFLSVLIMILFLNFINSLVDITDFINNYGMLVAFIVGGYLMNIFTFTLINKKWNGLKLIKIVSNKFFSMCVNNNSNIEIISK